MKTQLKMYICAKCYGILVTLDGFS